MQVFFLPHTGCRMANCRRYNLALARTMAMGSLAFDQ